MTSQSSSPSPSGAASEAAAQTGKLYRVGSLTYTKGALLTVLFWMLWADLALQIMESLQTIIPIQLERLGASSVLTGLVRDTMQAALTLLILPIIGAQSDRHRSPMGRRRPFLLFSILPISICLISLGYADSISQLLYGLLSPFAAGLTMKTVGISVIIVFAAGFFFFNNYTLPVYQYLIADIIPKEVMGKFIGGYRAVGAVAGFLFNKLLFPHVDAHIEYIYITCTLFYAFSFLLLVWRVREGTYPPHTETKRLGPVAFIKSYSKLCFSHGFYWKIYLTSLFYWAAIVPFYSFGILYFKAAPKGETMTALNLFPNELGDIRAWTFLIQLAIFPLLGILIDRFHALRFLIAGLVGMASCFALGIFFAYAQPHIVPTLSEKDKVLVTVIDSRLDSSGQPERSERVVSVAQIARTGAEELTKVDAEAPAGTRKFFEDKYYNHAPLWTWAWWFIMMSVLAVIQLSYLAMQPALFPRDSYGQFCAANQWIFSIGLLLAPLICGFVLDLFKDYRMIFIWSSAFFTIAAFMSISLYRHWKRLGGDQNYSPPI
jgi:MFS family permease